MKSSKSLGWLVVVIIIIAGVGLAGKRYYDLNQVDQHPVREKMFSQGQWVKIDSVNFKVLTTKTTQSGNERQVAVVMKIQQLKPSHYGNKRGNYNITHGMWLNIPYGYSNMSIPMRHLDGRPFTQKEVEDPTEKSAQFYFTTRADDYQNRTAAARLSILIPENEQFAKFTKYSMPLES